MGRASGGGVGTAGRGQCGTVLLSSDVIRRARPLAACAVAAAAGVVALRAAEHTLLDRWGTDRRPWGPEADREAALVGQARSRRVETDDGARLRLLEWGRGRPIVLIHGITANSADWLPVLPPLLAAGHRVIALDQRGHGGSTLGTDTCDTERLAADLVQVLDELDVHEVVVAGHSLGGYVALAAAALHPETVRDRVQALVLLGAPHTGRGLPEASTLLTVAAPWTPRLQRSEPHGAVAMGLVAFGPSPDRGDIDEVRYRWAACPAATRRSFARALLGQRLTPVLDRVDLPVVVARGTHDRIVTARRNRALVARLRHARTATFDGAGHALLCEQPREVAEVILSACAPHRDDGDGRAQGS